MHELVEKLFPICRSITGNGVRETLRQLQEYIPLQIHEVATGTPVFDWTIPREWNIRDAYIRNERGEKIVDFQTNNLHVLNYSVPVHKKVSLAELREHLFTIPEHPDWIPYRTSYYQENWGFCLSHTQFLALTEQTYEVMIDASLEEGHLSYGEYYLPGATAEEVLISCHVCHPSLANDNLSGIAVSVFLAQWLARINRRYSYRFLYIPGTIGSITWLALNEEKTANIRHGLVATLLGSSGNFTYKKSRRGNAFIDQAVSYVLSQTGKAHEIIDFFPYGYDERQYCSPAFNLAVGCLMRTPHGQFPEYHTSADNLDFVKPEALAEALDVFRAVMQVIEENTHYRSLNPACEPQLGKRGLYKAISGTDNRKSREMAMLWVLNLSDGEHSLLDIAQRSGIAFEIIADTARLLTEHQLLAESR
jgi:aminopeptidase-like protein